MSSTYPQPTPEMSRRRRDLAPSQLSAFEEFSKAVFADGALAAKTKQIVAVAIAHVTQCPYCIRGHTRAALRAGATEEELMEAIWIAAEMRAGGAYAHSSLMLATVTEQSGQAAPGDKAPRCMTIGPAAPLMRALCDASAGAGTAFIA